MTIGFGVLIIFIFLLFCVCGISIVICILVKCFSKPKTIDLTKHSILREDHQPQEKVKEEVPPEIKKEKQFEEDLIAAHLDPEIEGQIPSSDEKLKQMLESG